MYSTATDDYKPMLSIQTLYVITTEKGLIFKGFDWNYHRYVYKNALIYHSEAPQFESPQYQILFSIKKHAGYK